MKTTQTLLATIMLSVMVAPASASTFFDFANLKWDGSTNSGFLPTDGVNCTSGDLCSSNVNSSTFNGDLNYTISSLTATATGTYNRNPAAVVQDHENNYSNANQIGAGLGVYHQLNNSDDNITSLEVLTLTFNQTVTLSALEMRSEGHNTSWGSNAHFLFNGADTLLQGTIGGLSAVGTTFTFAYGGTNPDQFYLGGMTVTAVPEPETYAMFLAGLGLMGFMARRRSKTS